jgi:putative redox protein
LLQDKPDAEYVAAVLSAWAPRYLQLGTSAEPVALPPGEVEVTETLAGKYAQRVTVGPHRLEADEPTDVGGDDTGPSPYGLLLAGLGACTSMTVRMYAAHKQLPLERVSVRLRHQKVRADECQDCRTETGKVDVIERELRIEGALSQAQRQRMLEIADRCPVHRTLHSEVVVRSRLASSDRDGDESPLG